MHIRDIIHRDLKPANIFYELKKNGIHILKIGDFGCARLDLKDAIGQNKLTKKDLGSPGYRPPEFIKSQPYNSKFDIWSIGVTFYELLTGTHPFIKDEKERPQVTETAIKETNPYIPETLSPATKELLMKMLEKDPQNRSDIT